MKLLYLPDGFTHSDRVSVESERSVFERWQAALDLSMRKHHAIRPTADIGESLRHDDLSRYKSICRVLEDHLKPIINIRNKLAHGSVGPPTESWQHGRSPPAYRSLPYRSASAMRRLPSRATSTATC